MAEGRLRFSDYKTIFFDKFGNRLNNYIVEMYYKDNGIWHLERTIKTHVGEYFVVDGKFYFLGNNDNLIPLNMDFESEDCRACYVVVGEDTAEYIKIVGNEYLCKNEYLNLTLHRQDYSDGTCFYTLEDDKGEFRVDYGNRNLSELIKVLKSGIEVDKKYVDILPFKAESIAQTLELIKDIKQLEAAEKWRKKKLSQEKK